jgi:hypothetical protein
MGEGRKHGLRVEFDGRLRLEFHGVTINEMQVCSPIGNSIMRWDSRRSLKHAPMMAGRQEHPPQPWVTIATIGIQSTCRIRRHERCLEALHDPAMRHCCMDAARDLDGQVE